MRISIAQYDLLGLLRQQKRTYKRYCQFMMAGYVNALPADIFRTVNNIQIRTVVAYEIEIESVEIFNAISYALHDRDSFLDYNRHNDRASQVHNYAAF